MLVIAGNHQCPSVYNVCMCHLISPLFFRLFHHRFQEETELPFTTSRSNSNRIEFSTTKPTPVIYRQPSRFMSGWYRIPYGTQVGKGKWYNIPGSGFLRFLRQTSRNLTAGGRFVKANIVVSTLQLSTCQPSVTMFTTSRDPCHF